MAVKFLNFLPLKGNTKVHWKAAIEDCLQVVEKTNDERVELSRIRAATPTTYRKRRRESCDSPDLTVVPQSKKLKFEEAEKLIEAIPDDVLDVNRRKLVMSNIYYYNY